MSVSPTCARPEFAFRGRELKLELTVQAYGLKGKTLPLYFNRGKNLITSRSISVNADPFEQKITFSFMPKKSAPTAFRCRFPSNPGSRSRKTTTRNLSSTCNGTRFAFYFFRFSAWNYRFLRMALKQDPLIELVSFVFLPTPTDSVDVPENQLSLIPFPIDDIFLGELKNFDVVIFDDFSHRAYFNPVYLDRVKEFVRDGGALAMFGGARAFDSGGYAESGLKDVLPVELDGKGRYETQGTVNPVLTASGKAHPVTRLLPDPKVTKRPGRNAAAYYLEPGPQRQRRNALDERRR